LVAPGKLRANRLIRFDAAEGLALVQLLSR
jgi:hypothetical protein